MILNYHLKLLVLILALIELITQIGVANLTPLDDYVFLPDPNYAYTLLQTYKMPSYTLLVYNFTSQKWYDGKNIY